MQKKTVILDTDLGTDIDDSWAIAMLLNSPELDLRLLTTTTGDTQYRAVLAERILEAAGRTDIPVAAGRRQQWEDDTRTIWSLVKDDPRLSSKHYPAAAEAIVQTVKSNPGITTLIEIGPMTNLGDVLELAPEIAEKIDLVAMCGSVFRNPDGTPGTVSEYNIKMDIPASKKVLNEAMWHSFTITPLDTCGDIHLPRETVLQLEQSSPLMAEILRQNRAWDCWPHDGTTPEYTSCLFDTVAIYLAYSTAQLKMQTIPLFCCEDGMTIVKEGAHLVNVAVEWKDKNAYLAHLTERLRVK